MFQLTHVYVASKVLGNKPYAIFGAILPDYTILKENGLLDDFEYLSIDGWLKVKDKDLAKGILTHKIVDQISHNGNKFPSFSFSSSLHAMFHLIPELAVELYVAKTYPQTIGIMYGALRNIDTSSIGAKLAPILKVEPENITHLLDRYVELVYLSSNSMKMATFFVDGSNKEACLELCIKKCQDAIASWEGLRS